ncbi:AMP-binding enzyme, partial [Rothia mucilaginosa]
RAKDQINRNGEKIAVDEIEELALTHPDVFDAVVLGIPDETVGERVGLVIVPQEGADLGENPRRTMHEFFTSKKLADFKIPERVQVLQELPTTNVGKISRRELRAKLAEIFG